MFLTILLTTTFSLLVFAVVALFYNGAEQRKSIAFLSAEKAKLEALTGCIQNVLKCGGWIDIVHNGKTVPFGVLVDKMEPETESVH